MLTSFLDDLGRRSPLVVGYYYPFFRDMLSHIGVGTPNYFGAFWEDHLVGVIPSFSRQASLGTVYNSLPFFSASGGVLANCDERRKEIVSTLLLTLAEEANNCGSLTCTISSPFLYGDSQIYEEILPDALIIDRLAQYQELGSDDWDSVIGRNLRKAGRFGIEVSKEITSERVNEFFAVYEQNCLRIGIPVKPKKCIEFLTLDPRSAGHVEMYFATRGSTLVGGLLIIVGGMTANYYIPCSLEEARTLQPGPLLIDFAMRDLHTRGIRFWNWEGSPSRESGVYRFKKKWGGIDNIYQMFVQPFVSKKRLLEIGARQLSENFPFYYVYPFGEL